MNYNKDNKDNDLNIKSHLDASLDLSGISVSEELINNTLAAIRLSTSEAADKSDKDLTANNKEIPWNRYVHRFARVAVVLLVVAAGYAMLTNMNNMKKYESNGMKADRDMTSYNAKSQESTQEYSVNYDTGVQANDEDAIKGTADTAGIAAIDENTISNENDIMSSESDKTAKQFRITTDAAYVSASTIRDIFIPEPEMIQSLTITDMKDNSITLTDKNDILDLYSVMDKYQYTNSTTTDTAEVNEYVITAKQQNEAEYSMIISKNILVEYNIDETSSKMVYDVADIALLLDDLQEFFIKYN